MRRRRRLHHGNAVAVAVAVMVVAVLSACSGAGSTPTAGGPTTTADGRAKSDPSSGDGTPGTKAELPEPPKSSYEGRGRVVNLYVDDKGGKVTIDVWAKRTFTEGPVLLAKAVEFGKASAYFETPKSHSIVFTKTGTSSDDKEIASMFNPAKGDQVTAVLAWDNGKASAPNFWEKDTKGGNDAPAPPAAGKGLLVLRAYQLTPFEKSLTAKFGGRSFEVGDGSGGCLAQRLPANVTTASVLGGTQPTIHEVAPGTQKVSLHKWPDAKKCATDPVFTFDVDVKADAITEVFVYTPDGATLATLTVPVA